VIRWSILGAVLIMLAGCGSESGPPDVTSAAIGEPAGEPRVLGVYSATAARGATGPAVPADHLDELLSTLRGTLVDQVRGAADEASVPDGHRLWVGVVAIDCAAPSSASVTSADGGYRFQPVWTTPPPQECFAPVTSVAVALVPDGWSGS